MKQDLIRFFKKIFPFIAVIFLWRLSGRFWNPGGILAIIPIFYCAFVKHTKNFTWFAVLFCFLLDYNFETKLFWTSVFCLMYAIDGFQNYVDISGARDNAIRPFMIFMGICIVLLSVVHLNWTVFARMLWIFVWCSILYFPITESIKRISYD